MIFPNADRAIVDIAKIRDYCLNPNHLEWRHKARVFASALGLTVEDADELQQMLLSIVKTREAVFTREISHGQLYVIDFEMTHETKRAKVRSSWIVRHDEDFPRLTSCYVL